MKLAAGLLVALVCSGNLLSKATPRSLTFDDRVIAQKAIEQVYWNHRIWPRENPGPKPPLSAVMSDGAIRAKVEDYLEKSNALDELWQRPITGSQLQAELDRMAHNSNDRNILREIFKALGDDPVLIAETLARQALAERLARTWYEGDVRFHVAAGMATFDTWWKKERSSLSTELSPPEEPITLPALEPGACARDTWRATRTEVPDERGGHVAVWTGSEMIVWGGAGGYWLNTGGRYNPATDTWTPTSVGANVPVPRQSASAVWTGTEMIVWGGDYAGNFPQRLNTGARYDPANDSWTPTSTAANVPQARVFHTAIWTGTEMIVWGGFIGSYPAVGDGGRYNPVSDTWLPVSMGSNAPTPRVGHTAIWTGSDMLVWGGTVIGPGTDTNSGGRYSPASDSWLPTSTGNDVPAARDGHTAVWTGTEMIVWGGTGASYDPTTDSWTTMAAVPVATGSSPTAVWTGTEMIVWGGRVAGDTTNIGARYNPIMDSWVPTSMGTTVPPGAEGPVSVWTGTEMIVWGGYRSGTYLNTGGAYSPGTDNWMPTSLDTNVPSGRENHTAVWTGSEMIVWGGLPYTDSGGRYDPAANAWATTSVGSNVPSPRQSHTAVWSGSEMIVWGGLGSAVVATGGRYNPVADSWVPTSVGPNLPTARTQHAAVWTGSEMIVWGGQSDASPFYLSTGGRYDPTTDSWVATATGATVPSGRKALTAVWTGTEMIVWGGFGGAARNTGGRYSPFTDSWVATSTGTNVPAPRDHHVAVWTGTEMIVFGGNNSAASIKPQGGGRYDLSTDSWTLMSDWPYITRPLVLGAAVWTGTEMIVWGGIPRSATGGVYCACPAGQLVYRDADGDGYGDPAISIPSCDGSVPPEYVADHTDCNDADPAIRPGAMDLCNGVDDNCDGIVDNGGSALCDDGNVCTDDTCSGSPGCSHTNNSDPCDDRNACTTNDTCSNGTCVGGAPLNCDDINCCTVDSCDPTLGCQHTAAPPPTIVDQPSLDGGGGSCPSLWPPNHGYVDFGVADTGILAAAICGGLTYTFASCSSSQAEDQSGGGDGNSVRDCVYEPGALHLRAERDGTCSPLGRTYTMTMTVTDVCGRSTESVPFTACLWHDKEQGPDPSLGRVYSPLPGSNQIDTRPGIDGTYGTACGNGCGLICGEKRQVHDSSDDDRPNLTLTVLTGGLVRLDWALPAPGDPYPPNADYEIWRRVHGNGPYTKIGQVSHDVDSFTDTQADDGQDYDWSVNALY